MELKRREFENLAQNDKPIMKYVKEFTLLSRYASEDMNTDDKRKKRFMRGLHPGARIQLRMLKAADFQELVDATITMEDDFKQVLEDRRKKANLWEVELHQPRGGEPVRQNRDRYASDPISSRQSTFLYWCNYFVHFSRVC
jgi:hypothetical protein